METLESLNTKTYDTILAGLNTALAREVGEAKEHLVELRTEFIQTEKQIYLPFS